MHPRVCVCCGEPMSERGNTRSRNPNVCASCSSLADGMDDRPFPVAANSLAAEPQPTADPDIAEVYVPLIR